MLRPAHLLLSALALFPACLQNSEAESQQRPGGSADAGVDLPPPGASWDASGWQKPSEAELRARLTELQFEVTQQDGTERSFQNTYWDNKAAGLYVDIVSGEPLFSSTHKYKSGTGWPSFWQPLSEDALTEHVDSGLFMTRTEVRSRVADSHLGHVFDDGPAPTGLRYCMNSAALRFVPVEQLEAEGYGAWLPLFGEAAVQDAPDEPGAAPAADERADG